MINHATSSPEVLMYVDSIVRVNNKIKVVGWITHTSERIESFVLSGKKLSVNRVDRPDVLAVYPNLPSVDVGVEFEFDASDLRDNLTVFLRESRKVINVGTLEETYIRRSGFDNIKKNLVIVEDFYADPDAVRDFAIKNLSFAPSGYHRGQRTSRFILDGTQERLETILGRKIYNWEHNGYANGAFQFCAKNDPIVYHVDSQMFAGIVFLTPDAPLNSGTGTYKSKLTGARRFEPSQLSGQEFVKTFSAGKSDLDFYDNSTLELVDRVANVYNRLVLWDARTIHAAEGYFGDTIEDSRFFHLFFFDVE